jgi:hypothetical protein
MTFSPEEYDCIHALERRIHDPELSIEERRRAVAALVEFGEDAEPILIAISVGHWLQPLPSEVMTEAARCAELLREPGRRRRERKRTR